VEPSISATATRARPLDRQPRGWLCEAPTRARPRNVARTRRFHESGRPGSNRRRPAWEAFLALVGQRFFGGGSRNRITQYPRARPGTRRFGPSSLVLEPAPDAVAGLVGLGARAHAARPQAHGRSRVHGAGPPTDARRRIGPPARRRGRQWVVTTRHRRRAWEIVVEPDEAERVLVVITAYPVVRGRGS